VLERYSVEPGVINIKTADTGGDSSKAVVREYRIQNNKCVFRIKKGGESTALFCMPGTPSLTYLSDGGAFQGIHTFRAHEGRREISFSPEVGWIMEREPADRAGRIITRTLTAYRVGSRRYGDTAVEPVVCDWAGKKYCKRRDKCERSRIVRPGDDDYQFAIRHLNQYETIYKHHLNLSRSRTHGWRRLYMVRDDSQTALRFEKRDGSSTSTSVIMAPVVQVKSWKDITSDAEFVAVMFETESAVGVRIFRVDRGRVRQVENRSYTMQPKPRKTYYGVYLGVTETGCFMEIRQKRNDPYGQAVHKVRRYGVSAGNLSYTEGSL
jgi:hypothetical protein